MNASHHLLAAVTAGRVHQVAKTVRRWLLFALVMLASPALAIRYGTPSQAELIAEADEIFVGTVFSEKSLPGLWVGEVINTYTVKVGRVLKGTFSGTVVLRGAARLPDQRGKSFVFMANRPDRPIRGVNAFVRWGAIQPYAELGPIGQQMDWCEHPERYLADSASSKTPGFLLLTSSRLKKKALLGSLSREQLIAHYRECMASADEKLAWAGVEALVRIEDAASASVAVELLSKEASARFGAYFLVRYPIREAIKPLCDLLERVAPEEERGCERSIALALMKLDASETLPAIRVAVDRGLNWDIVHALGFFGQVEDFDRLLPGLASKAAFSFHTGLVYLVSRSNFPVEPWMRTAGSEGGSGFTTRAQWNEWVQQHKADIRILHSGPEAGLRLPSY